MQILGVLLARCFEIDELESACLGHAGGGGERRIQDAPDASTSERWLKKDGRVGDGRGSRVLAFGKATPPAFVDEGGEVGDDLGSVHVRMPDAIYGKPGVHGFEQAYPIVAVVRRECACACLVLSVLLPMRLLHDRLLASTRAPRASRDRTTLHPKVVST